MIAAWSISDVVVVAVIGAAASVTTAILSRGRKTQRKIAKELESTNGSSLAQTVERIERTGEVVEGRVHDISKRVDATGHDLEQIRSHVSGIEANVIGIADRLEDHIDERKTFEPLIAWVREQMTKE